MVRCFIGIMMPEELKEYVEVVQKELSALPMKCKFVEKYNLHICLSFLGEVEEDKIKSISEDLDFVCSGFSKFEISIDGMKVIPNENYIRVLALDTIDRTGTSKELIKKIQERIGGDSHPPHLTLCRIRNITDKPSTAQKIKAVKTEEKTLQIADVQLIKSELKKTGPVYSVIHSSRLL